MRFVEKGAKGHLFYDRAKLTQERWRKATFSAIHIMPGRVYNTLAEIAVDQYGYVTAQDAEQHGVDPHRLVEMARRGTIERVAHGIYRMPVIASTGLEQLMEATLWPRGQGVLSHETALDLHKLCDVNPAKIHVTVPRAYRITRDVPQPYLIHHRDLEAEEVTRHEGIAVVTPIRAILDGIATHLRGDLLGQAVETARGRGLLRGADLMLFNEQLGRAGKR
jgi:predicted transcriptional regulator of viral defense system